MKRVWLSALAAALCLCLAGCQQNVHSGDGSSSVPPVTETVSDQTWAIYWYLCGSDLESWYGCATEDLEEMMAVTLPENVQVVIQTGGAPDWFREEIQPDRIGRYLYDSSGLALIEEQPQANMGEAETLESFLQFCTTHYPADRTMVLFWNHGGGSVNGAAFDANYYYDSLTIDEFRTAFEAVCDLDPGDPPFDVVGFDACLMATIDVASTFRDVGRYLVASEELEPGNGWYYTGWMQALADDPGMDGAQLGQAICDAYMEGCERNDTADEITLSVVDLSKIDRLLEAYNDMGTAALMGVVDDPNLFTSYSRGAVAAESYGGNTEEEGYTNMVDLGHLSRNNMVILPDSAVEIHKALEDCVVYKVNGPYRSEASGLSCFHSYNADLENFVDYTAVGCSEAFKYLYGYGLSGKISDAGLEYVRSVKGSDAQAPDMTDLLDISVLEGADVYIDEDGTAVLDVLPRGAQPIVNVRAKMLSMSEEGDSFRFLGESSRVTADYEEGIFRDQFDAYWPSIDGNFVFTRLIYRGEDYTTYSVPILLNGEEHNLRVVYDHELQDYTVLGARKGLSDTGMADKNLILLKPGDQISTIYLEYPADGNGGFEHKIGANFTLTEDTMFYEAALPNGEYSLVFEMTDARRKTAWSELVSYIVESDAIYTVDYTPYEF